jgi:hypothetical protein
MATTTPVTSYPWQPDSTKTALRAIGDLGVGLMAVLKTQRGIHTETLMTVTGALAGFAAQNAALTSITAAIPSIKPRSLAIAQPKTGGIFLFGDAINAFLFQESGSVLSVAPQLEPLAALLKFWPQTLAILARPPIKRLFRYQEAPLQEIHRPIILGLVASQFIKMSKAALHPRISAALVMESAVITSKIDPEMIEPGKWRIDTLEAGPGITRLRT